MFRVRTAYRYGETVSGSAEGRKDPALWWGVGPHSRVGLHTHLDRCHRADPNPVLPGTVSPAPTSRLPDEHRTPVTLRTTLRRPGVRVGTVQVGSLFLDGDTTSTCHRTPTGRIKGQDVSLRDVPDSRFLGIARGSLPPVTLTPVRSGPLLGCPCPPQTCVRSWRFTTLASSSVDRFLTAG